MRMRKQSSPTERVLATVVCLAMVSTSWAQAPSGESTSGDQQAPSQQPQTQPPTPEAPAAAQPQNAAPSISQQAKDLSTPTATAASLPPFHVELPRSRNPFSPYMPSTVPPVNLTNSPRLEGLERDGKLYLSLQDAIALALENNLDLAYFRYNLPIAQADLARTKAGAQANGVNTSIVQGTQGGFSASGVGGGGGSSGVQAVGAGGLVQSTLGGGAPSSRSIRRSVCEALSTTLRLSRSTPFNLGCPY